MVVLTKEQRKALKRIYDRAPIYTYASPTYGNIVTVDEPLTYRQFRKLVRPASDWVVIWWKGMWLGIEKDGYVHS